VFDEPVARRRCRVAASRWLELQSHEGLGLRCRNPRLGAGSCDSGQLCEHAKAAKDLRSQLGFLIRRLDASGVTMAKRIELSQAPTGATEQVRARRRAAERGRVGRPARSRVHVA